MPYPFPDPAVTPEFEAENGITYIWGGDKWIVKTFTSPTNYITPAVADTEYVRIDGTSTMAGDLQFSGNRSVKSDGIMKVDGSVAELAQNGTTCLTIDGSFTTFRYRDVYFLGDVFLQQNVTINGKAVATEEYAIPANGTQSTSSPFEVTTAISHNGYNYFKKKGSSFFISCESGPTIFGVSTADTAIESAANYYGKCTSANHVVNKGYLEENTLSKEAIKTAAATATTFAEFQALIAAL